MNRLVVLSSLSVCATAQHGPATAAQVATRPRRLQFADRLTRPSVAELEVPCPRCTGFTGNIIADTTAIPRAGSTGEAPRALGFNTANGVDFLGTDNAQICENAYQMGLVLKRDGRVFVFDHNYPRDLDVGNDNAFVYCGGRGFGNVMGNPCGDSSDDRTEMPQIFVIKEDGRMLTFRYCESDHSTPRIIYSGFLSEHAPLNFNVELSNILPAPTPSEAPAPGMEVVEICSFQYSSALLTLHKNGRLSGAIGGSDAWGTTNVDISCGGGGTIEGNRVDMALQADGRILAAGRNSRGMLADGTTVDRGSPVPVGLVGGEDTLGTNNAPGSVVTFHNVFILHTDGSVSYTGCNRLCITHVTLPERAPQFGVDNVKLAASGIRVVALKRDGTVLARTAGYMRDAYELGMDYGSDNLDVVEGSAGALYVLKSVACVAGTYSSTGNGPCIVCESPFVTNTAPEPGATSCSGCEPGKTNHDNNSATACAECPVGRASSVMGAFGYSACKACNPGMYAGPGQTECGLTSFDPSTPCKARGDNTVGEDGSACRPCAAGQGPNANYTGCVPCPFGQYSAFGSCEACGAGKIVVNSQSACEACEAGTQPSNNQSECVCDDTSYNAYHSRIVCHEDEYEEAPPLVKAGATNCSTCGICIGCAGLTPVITRGYVRLNALPRKSATGEASVDIFRCKSSTGCFGLESVDPSASGCQERYTGYFCETCVDGFELKRAVESSPACDTTGTCFECVPCKPLGYQSLVAALAAMALAWLMISARKRIIGLVTKDATRVAAALATARSVWQPLRIVITYAQVTSEIGSVLSVNFSADFSGLLGSLARLLDLINIVAGAKCLGLDNFHYQWVMQVFAIPLGMLAVTYVLYVVEKLRTGSVEQARNQMTGNVFFIVFFCYPRICKAVFSVFICRTIFTNAGGGGTSVLVADDRVLCQDPVHEIFQWLSLFLILLVACGVPIGAVLLLYRERQKQPDVDNSLRLRVAGSFGISAEEAAYMVNDVRLGSAYGFLVDAYKPQFFMWESIDMIRKLVLVGLVLIFDRGSVAQIAIALSMSFFFLAAHMRYWPYKINLDNQLRAATEFHVTLTIAVGLVFRTDLDSPYSTRRTCSLVSLSCVPDARRYDNDVSDRKEYYDWLLITTFIIFVAGALAVVVAAKVRLVARTVALLPSENVAPQTGHEANMRSAYTRFQLGLANGSDHKDLVDFIDQLDVNEHVKAGKRLWRSKVLATSLDAGQMGRMLSEIEEQLPKSHALGFHFTDMDACRLILDGSQGIRASTVGQLGGGVSICLASLVELGWDKHGGAAFAKKVGEELWGSKWHEVMPEPRPEGAHVDWGKYSNKLEVVFVLRVPSDENKDQSRIVPGRPNVYIVPESSCEPGLGGDEYSYYSNTNIERCFVLKAPSNDAARDALDTMMVQQHSVRVQIDSKRDKNGGMVEVVLSEVDELERIEDTLEQNPSAPWCPIVASCTAMVCQPQPGTDSVLATHRQLQEAKADKQLWPENVSRFTPREMVAALHSIDQTLSHSSSLCYYYTSVEAASRMCKDRKGIEASDRGGVIVSLQSPADLGWEKYGGGDFKKTAGLALWGARWSETHSDQLEAVLIMGVPTKEIPTGSVGMFTIPEALLVSPDLQVAFYSNAHIQKFYVLKPPETTKASTQEETSSDLAALFAAVDADGDGQITHEEALQYLRKRGSTLDETYISMIWEAADSDGDGTLDKSEFPGFLEAVDRAAAKVGGGSVARAPQGAPERNRSMHETSAQVLFDAIDMDGSGLISFNEFMTWWSRRQLATSGKLDKHLAAQVQQKWEALDTDGSGSLDRDEFESLMTELATSEWKEAFDQSKGRVYYYNVKTKVTKWQLPDQESAVADFIQAANDLASVPARSKPLALESPPPLGSLQAPAATLRGKTTVNPLSQATTAFDVEAPLTRTIPRVPPRLDDLQKRKETAKGAAGLPQQLPPRKPRPATSSVEQQHTPVPLESLKTRPRAAKAADMSTKETPPKPFPRPMPSQPFAPSGKH